MHPPTAIESVRAVVNASVRLRTTTETTGSCNLMNQRPLTLTFSLCAIAAADLHGHVSLQSLLLQKPLKRRHLNAITRNANVIALRIVNVVIGIGTVSVSANVIGTGVRSIVPGIDCYTSESRINNNQYTPKYILHLLDTLINTT